MGIKTGAQRPKIAKHLRTKTEKRFHNDNPEAKERYKIKLASRAARKQRRRRKK